MHGGSAANVHHDLAFTDSSASACAPLCNFEAVGDRIAHSVFADAAWSDKTARANGVWSNTTGVGHADLVFDPVGFHTLPDNFLGVAPSNVPTALTGTVMAEVVEGW